jgi:hypothetical protein
MKRLFAVFALLPMIALDGCVTADAGRPDEAVELENKRLVRRYYEEVISAGDVDRIEQFIAPDYVEVYQNERHAVGLEGCPSRNLHTPPTELTPRAF